MSDLYVDIDISELESLSQKEQELLQERLKAVAQTLAAATMGHIQEKAQSGLHSRRKMFLDSLSFTQVSDGLWSISLDPKANWIDDGLTPHSLLPALLASPKAKVSKDGKKYISIPFNHSKSPDTQTPIQQDLSNVLKTALKNRGINLKKIDRNADGTPKVGLLHKFDLAAPNRKGRAMGLGESGPQGRPYSAHATKAGDAGPEGRPFLYGVRVYQKQLFTPHGMPVVDKKGQLAASRGIFTFRTASESQLGSQVWFYPGIEGKFFFEEGYTWALNKWEHEIKPEIIKNFLND